VFFIAEVCEVGLNPTTNESEYWGSTCNVFFIGEVCEVGATQSRDESEYWSLTCILFFKSLKSVKWVRAQLEMSQNIGVQLASRFFIAEVYKVGATPTRDESEYWGSTCTVFLSHKSL
jgi:hypothetical protein